MVKKNLGKIIAFCVLLLIGIVWIVPVAWVLFNSLKTDAEFFTSFSYIRGRWDYLLRMLPQHPEFINYVEIFTGSENINGSSSIVRMFANSFIVSGSVTFGSVIIVTLSAFAYERMNFRDGERIFWFLLFLSMFPNVVNVLPNFRIANALHWVDNLNALIWPSFCGVFNIFLVRNFMKGIPKDMDEAAIVDGASYVQVFTRVILPSIKPVLIVVGLFAFNGSWNDFLWPTIAITSPEKMPITIGMKLLNDQFGSYPAHAIATCLTSMVPPFIMYMAAQKYFLKGISLQGSIKG